jgi:Holliday junction resolvase
MINSNAKGKRGELEVVKLLNRYLGTKFRRTPNSGGLSIKGDIIDIDNTNPLYDFHIEIKNTNTLQIPKWMKQIENDQPLGKTGLLIAKFKGSWFTWLRLEDFLYLISTIMELQNKVRTYEEVDD